ncbi:MAG: hypothetical protein EKK53_23115 [Burkholderiales bacterium]|nr:MAG: hypothetical protein EKK53_23115 [Burkholderiales bacterium]
MTTGTALRPAEARQWLRLRELRVQRARRALVDAIAAEREVQATADAQQQQIDAGRQRLDELARRWSGSACVDLPRWSSQLAAHRAALEERLERDEYALIETQEALEARQAAVRQRRAELARAQARADAVDATLQFQQRDRTRAKEQQAELDAEDARRATH